jgi:hydrogenase maturation protease
MRAVVIGYGNTLRGDDGVGPRVAEAVAAQELPGVRTLAVPQLTPELAEVLAGARLAVFVDARANPAGGDVEVLRVQAARGPESVGHTSDPGVLLALTEAVYGAHPPAWLVRIPAMSFPFGAGLSDCASRGAAAALREVLRVIASAESGQ